MAIADNSPDATALPLDVDNRVSVGLGMGATIVGTDAENGRGFRRRDGAGVGFLEGVPADVEADPGLIPALNGVMKGFWCPGPPGVPLRREVIPRKRC